MSVLKEPEYESLVNWITEECDKRGLSKEKLLERLIPRMGFKKPRLKSTGAKLKISFHKPLIQYLQQKEKEIAERLKEGKRVVSMDTNKARYLIETALSSFECIDEGKVLHKKEIDRILGYNERTMRNQKQLYKDLIDKETTEEYEIYIELCREISQKA